MKFKLIFLSFISLSVIAIGTIGAVAYFSINKNNNMLNENNILKDEPATFLGAYVDKEKTYNPINLAKQQENDFLYEQFYQKSFLDDDYVVPGSGLKITPDQVREIDETKGVFSYKGSEFLIKKEGWEYYLEPKEEKTIFFENPILELPLMFDENVRDKINNKDSKWYPKYEEGFYEEGFFYIYFMDIGYVKIKDGKILGGFYKYKTTIIINEKLRWAGYPNGFELGTIENGINMLKLQSLKAYTDDQLRTSQSNLPTKTWFRFFKLHRNGVDYAVIAMNKDAKYPSELGVVPSGTIYDDNSIYNNWWFDDRRDDSIKSVWDHHQEYLSYYIGGLVSKSGEEYRITRSKRYLTNKFFLSLENLYYPIQYHTRLTSSDILGKLYFDSHQELKFPTGTVLTDGPIKARWLSFKYKSKLKNWKIKLVRYTKYVNRKYTLEESLGAFCNLSALPYYEKMVYKKQYKYISPYLEDIYKEWEKFVEENREYDLSFENAIQVFDRFKIFEGSLIVGYNELKTVCDNN